MAVLMNIPQSLDNNNKRKNVNLWGILKGEIERPKHMYKIDIDERLQGYALVDLVGYESTNVTGFAIGQVVTVITRATLNHMTKNNIDRLPVKLTNSTLKMTDNPSKNMEDYVEYLSWKKEGNSNEWTVATTECEIINSNENEEFVSVMTDAFKNGWVLDYPIEIPLTYRVCTPETEFVMINTDQLKAKAPTYKGIPHKENSIIHNTNKNTDNNNFEQNQNNEQQNEGSQYVKAEISTRSTMGEEPKGYEELKEVVKKTESKNNKIRSKLIESLMATENDSHKNFFDLVKEGLHQSWRTEVLGETLRDRFKEVVKTSVLRKYDKDIDTQFLLQEQMLLSHAGKMYARQEVAPVIGVDIDDVHLIEKTTNSAVYSIAHNFNELALNLIENILEIPSGVLVRANYSIKGELKGFKGSSGVDVITVCRKNPYLLGYFMDMDISVMDKLAMIFRVNLKDSKVVDLRGALLCRAFLLKESSVLGNSTCTNRYTIIKGVESVKKGSKFQQQLLLQTGKYVKHGTEQNLMNLLPNLVDTSTFRENKDFDMNVGDAYEYYIRYGLGVELELGGNLWVTDYTYAKKEYYILSKLRRMVKNNRVDIGENAQSLIDEELANFEKEREYTLGLPKGTFKLEKEQRNIGNVFQNGAFAITGVPGSGKTTCVELATNLINRFIATQRVVVYTAPTGKSASRLSEVVGTKVNTLHSQFFLSMGASIFDDEGTEVNAYSDKIIVIDESSFINLDDAYTIMTKLPESTIVIFLGDVEQLQPIGKGKIFQTILQMLPTLKLGVSKRSADGSSISLNCDRILNQPNQPLIIDDETLLYNTSEDSKITSYVKDIFKYYKGENKYLPSGFVSKCKYGDIDIDDIQVVTPINGKEWGVKAINKEIQDIVNPRSNNNMTVGSVSKDGKERQEFRLDDRVVHLSNEKERVHFVTEGGLYKISKTRGISNGDIGKVKRIVKGVNIKSSMFDCDEDTEERISNAIGLPLSDSDDVFQKRPTTVLMFVEYKTYSVKDSKNIDVTVVYNLDMKSDYGNFLEVTKKSIKNLDLAYALTTHKMQGSEAKVIIALVNKVGWSGSTFINKNMLYTIISRAKLQLYLIGDYKGTNSAFEVGRCINIIDRIDTVGDKFLYKRV